MEPQHPSRAPQPDDQLQCPGCSRMMRLVGRERRSVFTLAEVLTFECECGHLTTTTTGQ